MCARISEVRDWLFKRTRTRNRPGKAPWVGDRRRQRSWAQAALTVGADSTKIAGVVSWRRRPGSRCPTSTKPRRSSSCGDDELDGANKITAT